MFLAFLWNTESMVQTSHRIPCCITKMPFATQKHFSSAFFSPPTFLFPLSPAPLSLTPVRHAIQPLQSKTVHFTSQYAPFHRMIPHRLSTNLYAFAKRYTHNTCMAHSFYSPIHVNHATIADWTGNRWWPYSIKTQNKNHMKILHIQNFILPLHPQLGKT